MAVGRYWRTRAEFMYYRYIDAIVAGVGAEAKSLLDVGSAATPYIENFDWIEKRVAIDISMPYSSESVEGIKGDFFTYVPDERFDFVTCLQVLEHIPDASTFARKLFDVGRNVLISVPYEWPEKATSYHVHDPVNEKKLETWTQRQPDYAVVVPELFLPRKGRRLISYYHDPAGEFSMEAARRSMQKALVKGGRRA